MPTTRHHLNRRRRLAAVARPAGAKPLPKQSAAAPPKGTAPLAKGSASPARKSAPGPQGTARRTRTVFALRAGSTPRIAVAVLAVLTVLLGAFAGLGFSRAAELGHDPARDNTALTDVARTSEVKGQVGEAVGALFSYDYANTGKAEKATSTLLTGKAVAQHRNLLAGVRAQARKQKLVITTTVTDSAVERIEGDRARVLVYADQSSTSTAGDAGSGTKGKPGKGGTRAEDADSAQPEGSYAGAVFAVDVVRKDGHWIVSGIDTFAR